MRTLEIKIRNFRGVRDLELKPNGHNLVIWGPNGSGKSAVVDAIDFLLTGTISRLSGEGAGGLSIHEHAPHIDTAVDDSWVEALFELPGTADHVRLTRRLSSPGTLQAEPDPGLQLAPILDIARRGQLTLTRREILRYIWSNPGSRAQEIHRLLNIRDIEAIRRSLVAAEGDLRRELASAEASHDTEISSFAAFLGLPTFSEPEALAKVSQLRQVLGGKRVEKLQSAAIKADLAPPTVVTGPGHVNLTLLENDIADIHTLIERPRLRQLATSDSELRSAVAQIAADPSLRHELAHRELTLLGLSLIDSAGNCPLCDKDWPQNELREYLSAKANHAERAADFAERINRAAGPILDASRRLEQSLARPVAVAGLLGLHEPQQVLTTWRSQLHSLASALTKPIDAYPTPHVQPEQVAVLFTPASAALTLEAIRSAASASYPSSTPEQTAWDSLTEAQIRLQSLEQASSALQDAYVSHHRSDVLHRAFEEARDTTLNALYASVADRFAHLYRSIHGPDEDHFQAQLEAEGPGLHFMVDFYGRGPHPPNALHSEGHQDSMGVCLFLALAEHLSSDLLDLIILDDVVMSVDNDHRRALCHLLATEFPGRQFIITTHDRTWAHQLRAESVVDRAGTVEFFDWSLATGPLVNYEPDAWNRIAQALDHNDTTTAATTLRKTLEEFFTLACDSTHAPIPFKLSGRYELGDLLPSAAARLIRLFNKARNAAVSWNDKATAIRLTEAESIFQTIFARTQAEQWAINQTVHYNSWPALTPNDLRIVVDAMTDLELQFVCQGCHSLLYLTQTGTTDANLRCLCGTVNLNMQPKPNT